MGNVWFDIASLPVAGNPAGNQNSPFGAFSPYVGGGLGVAFLDRQFDSFDAVNDTGFAWQAGAGVRWNFVANLDLDVGYRFKGISGANFGGLQDIDFTSNNVIVGLVFNF